jgi:hypothetical protein
MFANALARSLSIGQPNVFTTTGNVTMVNEGVVFVKKASGAATTVTLPGSPGAGGLTPFRWVVDAKGDAATNNVTVQGASSATIDGASTYVISENYGAACFAWNGTEWNVVGVFNAVSATELGFLNGVTAGTAAASKALVLDGSKGIATITSLTATTINPTNIVRASQTFQLGRGGTAKAGTTAGWTVNAGNNLGTIATVAASQTNATLVVAIPNLHVGDTITGFSVYSSINSAGGAVTLDANLRTLTIAAGATATDASVASITQVSVSAATASTATKSGLSSVVAAGVNYYLLLTGHHRRQHDDRAGPDRGDRDDRVRRSSATPPPTSPTATCSAASTRW